MVEPILEKAEKGLVHDGRGPLGVVVELTVQAVDPVDEVTMLQLVFPDLGVVAGGQDLLLPGEVIFRIAQQREQRLPDRVAPVLVSGVHGELVDDPDELLVVGVQLRHAHAHLLVPLHQGHGAVPIVDVHASPHTARRPKWAQTADGAHDLESVWRDR